MGCCFYKRDRPDDDYNKAKDRNQEMKVTQKANNDIRIDT